MAGFSEDDILGLAAGVERASEHPLALAIVAAAKLRQLDIPEVSDFDSPTGQGAVGTVGGKRIFLGAGAYLNENGIDVSTAAAQEDGMRADGATAAFAAADGRVAGILAIADAKMGRATVRTHATTAH